MNRENKQNNIEKIEHRRSNKSKRIRNNLCLLIGIIVLILIVGTSFAVIKTTKTEVNVLDNLSGDTTEDVWQITSVSDEEETETIYDDSEVSAISKETDDENTDDGISTIDDSSDYTITVTEYTGDTLEAEFDYGESHTFILYIVDAESWQLQNAYSFSFSDTTVYSFSDYYSLEDGMRCGTSPIFTAEKGRGSSIGAWELSLTWSGVYITDEDVFQGGSLPYGNGVIDYTMRFR